jgi:hypothetical protein
VLIGLNQFGKNLKSSTLYFEQQLSFMFSDVPPFCSHFRLRPAVYIASRLIYLYVRLGRLFTHVLYFPKKLLHCSFMSSIHESTLLPQKIKTRRRKREESERRIAPETCHYEAN